MGCGAVQLLHFLFVCLFFMYHYFSYSDIRKSWPKTTKYSRGTKLFFSVRCCLKHQGAVEHMNSALSTVGHHLCAALTKMKEDETTVEMTNACFDDLNIRNSFHHYYFHQKNISS